MTTTKRAANQPNETVQDSMSVKTAQIGKQIASFLVPDYMEGQKLAIVDEGVLKFLKSLLPTANVGQIVGDLIDELKYKVSTLEDAVKVAKEFVAFHETVNLLKRYFDPSIKVESEEPFNVEKPAPTTDEMIFALRTEEARIVSIIGMSINDYLNKKHSADHPRNKMEETQVQPVEVGPVGPNC